MHYISPLFCTRSGMSRYTIASASKKAADKRAATKARDKKNKVHPETNGTMNVLPPVKASASRNVDVF
jgi:hypothetical protein